MLVILVFFVRFRPFCHWIIKLLYIDLLLNPILAIAALSGMALSNKLQRQQNRAARVITGLPYTIRSKEIRKQLGWSSLLEMRKQQKAIMVYKIVNGLAPSYMADMFSSQYGSQVYNLRNSTLNFEIPNARTELYRNSSAYTGVKIWNELPEDLKTEPSLNAFKNKIKTINFCIDNT